MSKAEERALEAYPIESHEMYDDLYRQRNAYVKGYHQAEKDLELTWEDISIIRQIIFDYNREIRNEMSIPQDEEYCKEVLRRFNEEKEEKVTLPT